MKRFALAALMTLGLTLAAGSDAHAASVKKDVMGRAVPVGSGRPALVFYTNQNTRETLQKHAFEQVFQLRDLRPIVVVHVDLRDVPGMFQGVAKKEVKKAHRESIQEMVRIFEKNGIEVPRDLLDDSLFMIPEPGGEANEARGLGEGEKRVIAEAVDSDGDVVASGTYPAAAPKLSKALSSERTSVAGR